MTRRTTKDKNKRSVRTVDELSRFKEMSEMSLPKVTNRAIKSELVSGMARKAERNVREEIDRESEKTVHVDVIDTTPPKVDDLYVGLTIEVERFVQNGGIKKVIEAFTLTERLSSESNMAGDVYKATRTWDGKEYGTVVLKTLKKKHLEGSEKRLRSLRDDAEMEMSNLQRFKGCPHILHPTGEPFELEDGRLVIQMEYLPRSFNNYLLGIETESALTRATLCGGIQIFRAIHFMENMVDREGPDGWTYIDMKESNLGMDLTKDEWIIKLLDLDSAVPTGPRTKSVMRYTEKYIDPEKMMLLHKTGIGLLAEPSETIYSTGLTLLYAVARRIGVNVRRLVDVSKLINKHHEEEDEEDSSQRVSRVSIYEPDDLKAKIEILRATDERNLIKVYYLNEAKRMMEDNLEDIYPDAHTIKELIDIHTEEILAGNSTVHPCVFEAIRECLMARIGRPDTAAIAWRFNDILEKYSIGKYE